MNLRIARKIRKAGFDCERYSDHQRSRAIRRYWKSPERRKMIDEMVSIMRRVFGESPTPTESQ